MPINKYNTQTIARLKEFMGDITAEQLRYVDCFTTQQVNILMPIAGACQMAALPMHKHPSYSFIISFSDTSIIQLPHEKLNTKPNTIYFLSPFVPHHEICEVGLPRYLGVFIRPDFLQKQAVSYKQYNLSFDETAAFPATDELLLVIKRFIRECKQKQAGYACMLESLSVEITHALLRSMLNLQDNNYSHVSRIEINRSIEYMRQNISEKLSLSILASFAGMSVSHYTRIFRKETGLSPIDYLIDMRLDVACHLLLGGESSLKHIAMDCGFSSHSHFSTSFHKKYNISPSEYLSSIKER